jgi:hypothetical protein
MTRSARDIRAAVRERAAAELKAREDAVVKVADVLEKRDQVLERLTAIEREARTAVTAALKSVPLADLAELTGAEAAELRRLSRGPADPAAAGESLTPDTDSSAAAVVADPAGEDAAPASNGARAAAG